MTTITKQVDLSADECGKLGQILDDEAGHSLWGPVRDLADALLDSQEAAYAAGVGVAVSIRFVLI